MAGAVPPPQTHTITDQAIQADDSEHWKEATLAEYNTLLQNGTWEIVDLPPGEKAIGSSWVFRIKRQSDGSIKRYKARIVAPDKTISKCTGLLRVLRQYGRLLLLLLLRTLNCALVDISATFTNGDLDEYTYMRQPDGFHEGGLKQGLQAQEVSVWSQASSSSVEHQAALCSH